MTTEANILIVDDDPDVCELLMEEVGTLGYDGHVAHDGDMALAELHHNDYDVVLLDINLPGASGLDILQDLNNHHARTKAVIISGFDAAEPASRAMKLGAVDYITKPFQLGKIHELLLGIIEDERSGIYLGEHLLKEHDLDTGVVPGNCRELAKSLDMLFECIKKKLGKIIDVEAISIEQTAYIARQIGFSKKDIDLWTVAKEQEREAIGCSRLNERELLSKNLSSGIMKYMKR